MKFLKKRFLVWLGALGSVASIVGLLAFFFVEPVDEFNNQSAVVTGDDSSVSQTQNDSLKSQHQNATVEGDNSTVLQRQ